MDIQPHVPSDELGMLVNKLSSHLARAESWEQFVNEIHGPPHLRPNLDQHEHPAGALLQQYQLHGVPVLMAGEPPSPADLDAKIERGAHQSARQHGPFIRQEMAEFIKSGYWVVLPYEQARQLPDLHLSPLGVKEERDRRPRLVADHTFYGENDLTAPTAPPESMQFGGTCTESCTECTTPTPSMDPPTWPSLTSRMVSTDYTFNLARHRVWRLSSPSTRMSPLWWPSHSCSPWDGWTRHPLFAVSRRQCAILPMHARTDDTPRRTASRARQPAKTNGPARELTHTNEPLMPIRAQRPSCLPPRLASLPVPRTAHCPRP